MKCPNCYNRISKKESVCPYCGKEVVDNTKYKIKEILILIIVIVFGIFSPRAIRMTNRGIESQEKVDNMSKYAGLSLEEVVEQNLDKDNTARFLLIKEKELKDYLNTNGYTITGITENVFENTTGNSLNASVYIFFSKEDDIKYNIYFAYEKGLLKNSELGIECFKEGTKRSEFNLPEDKINALGKLIDIDNAYSLLKEKYPQMTRNNNVRETYEFISNDEYHIVLREIIEDNAIDCKYYIGKEI